MKLPHNLLHNVGFVYNDVHELLEASQISNNSAEASEVVALFDSGLPPIISINILAVMFGYNTGFIYSMLLNPKAHYRVFTIPKGRSEREIIAPKVAIKAIQTWLCHHFQKVWSPNDNVHGFVKGRSHITAASKHLGAKWVFSMDIENFFPSVCQSRVADALKLLGYGWGDSIQLTTSLCCLGGHLVQGAPSSPVLSNIVLDNLDNNLAEYAKKYALVYTRYADDVVISGRNEPPNEIAKTVKKIIQDDGWNISERKTQMDYTPNRLKIHGLLVHGDALRLTKGYRNKIRAYKHLVENGKINDDDRNKVLGHLNYATQIDDFSH